MPFVRIDVDSSRTPAEQKAISDGVYRALVETVHAPPNDLFHIVTTHPPGELVHSKDYLGISRSEHFLTIQIWFYAGRTVEQKKAIYAAITENLAANPGVRKEDVFIGLIDTPKENWSYGNGEAQFAGSTTSAPGTASAPAAPAESRPWLPTAAIGLAALNMLLLAAVWRASRRSARSARAA